MLSNVLYSKWCGTIGPALYYIYRDHPYAKKIYYLGLSIGAILCAYIQLVMKHQMEKHFVEEQPAYVEIMRDHNEVDNWFLAFGYVVLTGAVVYIIYSALTGSEPEKKE